MGEKRLLVLFFGLSCFLVSSCVYRPSLPAQGAYLVDSGGRSIATLDIGASVETGARGLEPNQPYDFELRLDGETVSFARLTANSRGEIAPFPLWFHSGIVGCSLRDKNIDRLPPFMFRDFEDAQRELEGRRLDLSVRPSKPRAKIDDSYRLAGAPGSDTALVKDRLASPIGKSLEIPMRARRTPMVYPSTSDACLLNSAEVGAEDMFVSGRHFKPGELVELLVVPNQRQWRVGDAANDVTGASGVRLRPYESRPMPPEASQ